MATFKYKPDKVKHLTNIETLDTLHKKIAHNFDSRKNNLSFYKKELIECAKMYDSIDINKYSDSTEYMRERSNIKNKIQTIKADIFDIENDVSELDYYGAINDVLVCYYDETNDTNNDSNNYESDNESENLSNIEMDVEKDNQEFDINFDNSKLRNLQIQSQTKRKPKKTTRRRMRKDEKNNIYNILDFFCSTTEKTTDDVVDSKPMPARNEIECTVSHKASLYNDFMRVINKTTMTIDRKNKLKLCNNCGIEKKIIQSEGICVCTKCSEAEPIMIESEMLSHKDTVIEKVHYPYKRINHLMEWLNQFQAKESTDIPDNVYEDIKAELKKMKITKISKITVNRVKNILKKLKYSEYYEHTVYIVSQLTNRYPPSLSREIEEKIKYMFKQIQEPFIRHCPSSRINFLSYSYVLHKIFKIIGLDEYLHYFELLKSREKLRIQENIWSKICEDLSWPFYPSLNI